VRHQPEIQRATYEHAEAIAARARAMDILETRALVDLDAREAVLRCLDRSVRAWTWVEEGEPAAIFGLCTTNLIGERAVAWMVTTDIVDRRRVRFLRYCRTILGELRAIYPHLESEVDERHTACLRWLRSLGFTIHPARPFGSLKMPFHHVEIGA